MAELTNAQAALQAAVASYRPLPGDKPGERQITDRAGVFLRWLKEVDRKY